MTEALELLLISDVHHGPSFEAKAGPQALTVLKAVLQQLEREPATLLIDLGDRINNVSPELDEKYMAEVAAAFNTSSKERHHVLGNHDVKLLSPTDNARILRSPMGNRALRRREWTLILWSPPPTYRNDGCIVPREDISWLSRTLEELEGPAALFTHVPLGGGSMRGNYYFEGQPAAGATYQDLAGLQELLLGNDHLKVAVAGHVHWNSVNVIDGVPFLTVQSLSELATTAPSPAGAWARLKLGATTVNLDVQGRDRFQVTLPLRETGRHWLRRPGMPPWHQRKPMASPAEAKGVILDLDGVIYRGEELLPGAVEFVTELKSRGIGIVAVSNHSGASTTDLAARLRRMGVPLEEREVVSSIDATLAYLQERYTPGTTALVLGSAALEAAIRGAGFTASSDPALVVVGYQEQRDEHQLAAAAAAVAGGAVLIGTNADTWLPSSNGRRRPETGPYLTMVAAMGGRQPFAVLGKPNQYIGLMALQRLGCSADQVMVVGDTLATDIGLAKSIGSASALVLTGNTRTTDVLVPRPDFVFTDLAELLAAMAGAPGVSAPAASTPPTSQGD